MFVSNVIAVAPHCRLHISFGGHYTMTNSVPVDGADRSDSGYNYKETAGSTAGSNSPMCFFLFVF